MDASRVTHPRHEVAHQVTHPRPAVAHQSADRPAATHGVRLLLLDSSPAGGALIASALGERGYTVRLTAEGLVGLELLERESPDVVILDPLLPDVDGYDLCQRMRETSDVPILMLSTRFDDAHVVRGLGAGADDVVPRTIGLDELLARLEALRRRSRLAAQSPLNSLVLGDLAIDTVGRAVVRRGRVVRLSPREYRLLYHLALNAGMILSRDELLTWVWGPSATGRRERLWATVRRLRHKIEDNPVSPRYILTQHGIGYVLAVLRSP